MGSHQVGDTDPQSARFGHIVVGEFAEVYKCLVAVDSPCKSAAKKVRATGLFAYWTDPSVKSSKLASVNRDCLRRWSRPIREPLLKREGCQ